MPRVPSQASELYGTLNFLESGVFGRVGCGGLQPNKDHQYGRVLTVCPGLAKCFQRDRSSPCSSSSSSVRSPIGAHLVASDAALEGPRCGSVRAQRGLCGSSQRWSLRLLAGRPQDCSVRKCSWFATHFLRGLKSFVVDIELGWSTMLPAWCVWSVAVATTQSLRRFCHVIHVVLFALKAFVYWECSTSVANWAINWADPISRKGLKRALAPNVEILLLFLRILTLGFWSLRPSFGSFSFCSALG